MLAEEGDDLSSIEVPADLGPEGSSSSKSAPEPKEEQAAPPQPKKEEKAAASEPKKQEKIPEGPGKGTEQDRVGGGHKELKHPYPLFPSVARLFVPAPLLVKEG